MLILQSPARANAVLNSILDAVSDETEVLAIAVAYVTAPGARTLYDHLEAKIGSQIDTIERSIVTCFDYGLTEPEALEYLQVHGFDVRIANLGPSSLIRMTPHTSAFHPKVYVSSSGSRSQVIVGSANLTRRALTVNAEAVSSMSLNPSDHWNEPWQNLRNEATRLDTAILERYRELRVQRPAPPPDEPPIPPTRPPSEYPVFREAVEGGLEPSRHSAFWVDVGFSSGGSGNQLELPRRGHRFFGYEFDDYGAQHETIGELTIKSGTSEWRRPLTWHGNNRMERLNLPTSSQGGFEYQDKVVMFQRTGSGYEIVVVDPESEIARRWRDESAATGTLFRVSEGRPRLCGLL